MSKRKLKLPRDPNKEYPDPTPVAHLITFNGKPAPEQDVKRFMAEWSRANAEANHVETEEEANDFDIDDDESDDFFHNFTPYEMHEMHEIPQEAVSPPDTSLVQPMEQETPPANPATAETKQTGNVEQQVAQTGQ